MKFTLSWLKEHLETDASLDLPTPRRRTLRMKRDIAIVICSRGREDYLTRLLDDIDRAFAPALEAGGLSVCTFVYAQNYARSYLDALGQLRPGDSVRFVEITEEDAEAAYREKRATLRRTIAFWRADLEFG